MLFPRVTVWLEGVAASVKSGVVVGRTVNVPVLELVLPPAVTEIGPLVAPVGTFAVIWVALETLNVAPVPSKATAVALVKPVPVIVTLVPT